MGKGLEQTFVQTRYTNDEYAREKMFNIISQQANSQ